MIYSQKPIKHHCMSAAALAYKYKQAHTTSKHMTHTGTNLVQVRSVAYPISQESVAEALKVDVKVAIQQLLHALWHWGSTAGFSCPLPCACHSAIVVLPHHHGNCNDSL